MMGKRILLKLLFSGFLLLGFAVGILYLSIQFFPERSEQYYNPVFYPGEDRVLLFFLHPFILSGALAVFWHLVFRDRPTPILKKALSFGALYALVAIFPVMWVTFSAMDVTVLMVGMWWFYGFCQATLSGLVFSLLED